MAGRKIRIGGAALRGPMRVLSVALSAVFLLVLARSWDARPAYEAMSILQIRPGGDTVPLIERRLFTRDMLETTAARHGIGSASELSQAVALFPLTSAAGATLGYPVQNIGLMVVVRLPEAGQAIRAANDLALQVMDLAEAGQIDALAERLSLYRAEEDRLWQETAALASDPGLDAAGRRRLALMEAEYAEVKRRLAEFEVRSRIEGRLQEAPYVILSRASTAQSVAPPLHKPLSALAAAALALAILSSLIGRQITLPSRSAPPSDSGRSRSF